jgi:hypothetical protein
MTAMQLRVQSSPALSIEALSLGETFLHIGHEPLDLSNGVQPRVG